MDEKESTDQDDEMELLGLCSGRFTGKQFKYCYDQDL